MSEGATIKLKLGHLRDKPAQVKNLREIKNA